MKLLMLFVDGFEDTEAIATLDVISRGGDEVICASLMGRKEIVPKLGRKFVVDSLIEEINYTDFDGLIIPGGPGSFKIMANIKKVDQIITYFVLNKKLVSAICAAPFLIGRLGFLKNKNYTVHPGFENQIIGGNYLREEGVVKDDNFITAKSMYYSVAFGLEIHGYFHGKDSQNKLALACQGEK